MIKVRPWKLLSVVFVTVLLFAFVYRLAEHYGEDAIYGCKYAIGISGLAGIASLLPVLIIRHSSAQWFFLSMIIGSGARLFVTILGLAVVALIIDVCRMWFFGYVGLFYCLFLVAETLFAVRVLRQDQWESSNG